MAAPAHGSLISPAVDVPRLGVAPRRRSTALPAATWAALGLIAGMGVLTQLLPEVWSAAYLGW
jgi:hypothetical protein